MTYTLSWFSVHVHMYTSYNVIHHLDLTTTFPPIMTHLPTVVELDWHYLGNIDQAFKENLHSYKPDLLKFASITSLITHGPDVIIVICYDEILGVMHNI